MHKKNVFLVVFLLIILITISFSMPKTQNHSEGKMSEVKQISGVKFLKSNSENPDNIVVVHSFPTNSILLAGLIEYLADYFNVYFIDLPGFTKEVPPLEEISIEGYSRYVEQKVSKLNLDSYILAGISFGFPVVNNANVDLSKVRAILAIEPYLNKNYLHFGFAQNFLYSHLLHFISQNNDIENWVWENPFADEVLGMLSGQSFARMRTIIKEVDNETFFETAEEILKNDEEVFFKESVPYVLVINDSDGTVNAQPIIKLFTEKLPPKNLKVIYTEIEHYPKDVSKDFFATQFKKKDIQDILLWLQTRE